MTTTLCFYLYPIPVFLKTLATAGLLFLHVASPRINEANYFIISHVACKFSCIKNKAVLVLSEHERSGAIRMLKDEVRVSNVAIYHNCHPSTIPRLRARYQATGTVKDRRRSGQPRMATGVKRQLTSIVYLWSW